MKLSKNDLLLKKRQKNQHLFQKKFREGSDRKVPVNRQKRIETGEIEKKLSLNGLLIAQFARGILQPLKHFG